MSASTQTSPVLVRHESDSPKERSACGWRNLLLSRQDKEHGIAAWAHAVDIDGARPHYHKRSTELYYVLDGSGTVTLDGRSMKSIEARSSTFRQAWSTARAAGCASSSSAFQILRTMTNSSVTP